MEQFSIRRIKTNYTRLNKKVFHNLLPPSSEIEFVYNADSDIWGHLIFDTKTKKFEISMKKNFPDRKFFLNVLVHEMVHIGDCMSNNKMSHTESFYAFKEIVEYHGLELSRKY